MKIQPIKPDEIIENLDEIIPDFVVESVNNFLKRRYRSNTSCVIKQEDLIKEILSLRVDVKRQEIFDNGWLDFETIFEKAGWNVHYDKPGYNESYDAYFEFSKKKN